MFHTESNILNVQEHIQFVENLIQSASEEEKINFSTYLKSSSPSAKAGKEPPSRKGVMYLVIVTFLKLCIYGLIKFMHTTSVMQSKSQN